MTFSKEWNIRYENNTHMSVWPWAEVISHFMKFYDPKKSKINVLEVGCGAGANIPFFLSLKTKYFGIDGSKIIIKNLKKKFPEIKKNLVEGDFSKELPFNEKFDFIIDRSAVTHNSTQGIKNSLKLIHDKLEKNGKLICIDWFSTKHFEYKNGRKTKDIFTKNGYKIGEFGGKLGDAGLVHFSNKHHILTLFKNFKILSLDEKIIRKNIPLEKQVFAAWNVVASKIS